jgi:rhamnosyltransferase
VTPIGGSIVIPVKDGGRILDRALSSIFAQRAPFGYEVVVVDSGSDAETQAVLARYPLRLHPLQGKFNHGLTRDFGASLGVGEYVVFLTQDAIPKSPTWLATLLEPMIQDPAIAAVQGGIEERPDARLFFWDSNGRRHPGRQEVAAGGRGPRIAHRGRPRGQRHALARVHAPDPAPAVSG